MKSIIGVMVFLMAFSAQAEERVYEAKGRFTMGDDDTKSEAQERARQKARAKAIEEAGIYVESIFKTKTTERAGKVEEEVKGEIQTLTAGVVKIMDEDVVYIWEVDQATGNVTWICTLKARIDEDDVKEQIKKGRDIRQMLENFKRIQEETRKQISKELWDTRQDSKRIREEHKKTQRELVRLREEIKTLRQQSGEKEGDQQQLGELHAKKLFEKALQAQISERYQEAIDLYQQVVKLDPDNAEAHSYLGLALWDKGDLDGAIREYRQALKINPDDAHAHGALGVALSDKGDLDGAIREYRQALKINPDYAKAHGGLGLILAFHGDRTTAIRELRAFLRLSSNEQAKQWVREFIIKLGGTP